jgi:hypothetical protein
LNAKRTKQEASTYIDIYIALLPEEEKKKKRCKKKAENKERLYIYGEDVNRNNEGKCTIILFFFFVLFCFLICIE